MTTPYTPQTIPVGLGSSRDHAPTTGDAQQRPARSLSLSRAALDLAFDGVADERRSVLRLSQHGVDPLAHSLRHFEQERLSPELRATHIVYPLLTLSGRYRISVINATELPR